MKYPTSIFGPLALISVGVVWLSIKAGVIPISNLWALTYIWPYFLIAAGIGLILRSYWRYATVFMDLVIVAGTLFAIWSAPSLGWDNPTSSIYIFRNTDFNIGPVEAGSGNVIERTRDVDDFTAIELNYPAQIFITQGKQVSVTIEAEDNVLPGLQTRVDDETLTIDYDPEGDKRVNPTKAVKIYVVVKDLRELDFGSAGEITIETVSGDELRISIRGAGNLNLNEISVSRLTVNLSGAGSMTASGKADALDLAISGFGSFNGEDLHTQTTDVNLSGAGSATVWADKTLDATISGAGSVTYYGSPEVSKQISGVGSVSQAGEK